MRIAIFAKTGNTFGTPRRSYARPAGWSFCVAASLLLALSPVAARGARQARPPSLDARYDAMWAVCDQQTPQRTAIAERIDACNYLIGLGPSGHRSPMMFVSIHMSQAANYATDRQYDKALQYYDKFFQLSGELGVLKELHWMVYQRRASIYYFMGQYDKAKKDLDASDENGPFHAWPARRGLYTAYLRGDIAMAEKDYRAAADFYEYYYKQFKGLVPGLNGKVTLAGRLAGDPEASAPAAPGQSSDAAACRMFPNIC